MFATVVDVASFDPASRYILEKQTDFDSLADELAGLRLKILIAARWEGSASLEKGDRARLRSELEYLCARYFGKVDEIANDFGVQKAMDAQEKIERTVVFPNGIMPLAKARQHVQSF